MVCDCALYSVGLRPGAKLHYATSALCACVCVCVCLLIVFVC